MSVSAKEMRWLVAGMTGKAVGPDAGHERLETLGRIIEDLMRPESVASRYLDAVRLFAEEAWNIHWLATFDDDDAGRVDRHSISPREATVVCGDSPEKLRSSCDRMRSADVLLAAAPHDPDASASLLLIVRDLLSELTATIARPEELSNRALVNLVCDRFWGDKPIPVERQRTFFAAAAKAVAHLIAQRAERRLAEQPGLHAETAVPSQETTFALAVAAPLRTLVRERALERLTAVEPRLGEIYRLATYAGRNPQEIAELLCESVTDVEADLETAIVEVCLDDP